MKTKDGYAFFEREVCSMSDSLMDFISNRIKENSSLFTKKEYESIKNNKNLIKKIYILGIYDGNQIEK